MANGGTRWTRVWGMTALLTLGCGRPAPTTATLRDLAPDDRERVEKFRELGAKLKALDGRVIRVYLPGSGATAADLDRLEPWPGLQEIWLGDCPVGDAGLVRLAPLTGLRLVDLSGTRVTDAGLDRLAGLPNLESLNLRGTAVTDAGLARLGDLARLETLDLGETAVTDAGLDRLAVVPRLRELYLDGTGVTPAGADRFRRARPDCRLTSPPPP